MARGRVLVSVSYEGEEGGAELLPDTPATEEEGSTELRQRRPVDVGQVSSLLEYLQGPLHSEAPYGHN